MQLFTKMFMFPLMERFLQKRVGASNQLFQNFKSKGKISDKQLKYFTYEYEKCSNLGKHLLPKIHKRFHNVLRRLVIVNCGTLQRKLLIFQIITLNPYANRKVLVILSTKLKTYKTFQSTQSWLQQMQQVFVLVFHTRLA